jgi:small subunit ribosomal protein S1
MDRHRNNVVLSRRVVLEEGRKSERNEILEKLTPGMRLKGQVSSIVDFGAFVDLGGIDGLVHISELSWNHVTHPSEVVKVGDEVEVEVLDVDLNRERISLGLKQTTDDPWRLLVKNFPIGAIIEGKVTKLVNFGAFVELGDNIEGLVHISEMAPRHIESPAQVVHVGDLVQVKIQEIDAERRRISLSMKSAAETLGIEIEVAEPDPTMIRPKVKKRGDKSSDEDGNEIQDDDFEEVDDEAEDEVAAVEEAADETVEAEAAVEEAVIAEPEAVAEEAAEAAVEAVEAEVAAEPEPEEVAEVESAEVAAPEAEVTEAAEPEAEATPEPNSETE